MRQDTNEIVINKNRYKVRIATQEDKAEIMSLYRAAIGSEGCTWSQDYPNEDTFQMDVEKQNLFCLMNGENEIVAALSIDCDETVDALDCWNKQAGKMGELSRMVVKSDCRNQGLAPELIKAVMAEMKQRGYASVHYLVSRHHKKALAAYAKLDFKRVGESDLFGEEWFCYEILL